MNMHHTYAHAMHNPALAESILVARKRLSFPAYDPVRDARAYNIRADLAATINREVGLKRQEQAGNLCMLGVVVFFITVIVAGILAAVSGPMVFGVVEVFGLGVFLISSWIACLIIDPPTISAIARYRNTHADDMRFLAGLPDIRHPFDDQAERWPSGKARLCFL
jgi:hypothetical protein